jgi:hypothetical protein
MFTLILSILCGGAAIKLHSYFTSKKPFPPTALDLWESPPPISSTRVVEWRTHKLGDTLYTPIGDGTKGSFEAVTVYGVMEGNFYHVRFVSDPTKHTQLHSSLLFTREDLDISNRTKN